MAKGQPTLPAGLFAKFPKIQSLFKRYNDRADRERIGEWIPGNYSTREFEALKSIPWKWTEKVDGTNIRVSFDNDHRILIGGKSDAAVIQPGLAQGICKSLGAYDGVFFDRERLSSFSESLTQIVIYGEGFGPGIQKAGVDYGEEKQFIAYDIFIKTTEDPHVGYWMPRDISHTILTAAEIPVVPNVFEYPTKLTTLLNMFAYMMDCVEADEDSSEIKHATKKFKEGYVGMPCVDLFNARGGRIIVKLTYEDVKKVHARFELVDSFMSDDHSLISRNSQADGTGEEISL